MLAWTAERSQDYLNELAQFAEAQPRLSKVAATQQFPLVGT